MEDEKTGVTSDAAWLDVWPVAPDREVEGEDASPELDVEEYAREQVKRCWGDEPSASRVEWMQQQINTLWINQQQSNQADWRALESLQWHDQSIGSISALLELTKADSQRLEEKLDGITETRHQQLLRWNRDHRWQIAIMIGAYAAFATFLLVTR